MNFIKFYEINKKLYVSFFTNKGVKKKWSPYISAIFKLIVGDKEIGAALSVPIINNKGQVIGILSNAQRTLFLQSIIKKVFFDKNAKVTIMDQLGQMVYSNTYSVKKDLVLHPYLPMIKKGSLEQNNYIGRGSEKKDGKKSY